MAVTVQQSVAALYAAIFNRAPDAAGLEFWGARLQAGVPFETVAQGFALHEVFTTGIGALNDAAYVAALYSNVLGSAGDATGVAYWISRLANGESKAAIAASFVQGALTIDLAGFKASSGVSQADYDAAMTRQQTLLNKADVGIYFAQTVGARSNLSSQTTNSKAALELDPAYIASKNALAGVTADAGTVTTAKAAILNTVTPAVPPVAPAPAVNQTFTLTTDADPFTGGAGNDTFTGQFGSNPNDAQTLTGADTLVGGAGTDTLNISIRGGTTILNGAKVSGIEIFNVRNSGSGEAVLDASTSPDLTRFNVETGISSGSVGVTNLAAGSTLGIHSNGAAAMGFVEATYATGVTTGNIVIDGGVTAGSLLFVTGNNLTTVTLTSTGASNSLGGLRLTNVSDLTIEAQSNLSTGSIMNMAAGAGRIIVKGAGTANMALATGVVSLDASDNTGGVTAVLNTLSTLVVKGTATNDTFTAGGVLETGPSGSGSVDAGAGTDLLVVTNTNQISPTSGPLYKGFEQLQVNAGVDVNMTSLQANNTIDTIIINGGGTNALMNLNAIQAANIKVKASTMISLVLADASGNADTVKLALNTAAGNNINLDGFSAANIENLELTGDGVGSLSLALGNVALNNITLKNAGTNSLSLTSTVANLKVDASGSTGNTTIEALSTGTPVMLIGGSGSDSLTSGNGDDTLTGGAGADTLAGRSGTNTFVFAATDFAADSVTDLISAKDTITDWTMGTNKIDFGATVLKAVAHTGPAVAGTASINGSGFASFNGADSSLAQKLEAVISALGNDAAGTSAAFADGADGYVFVSNGTAGINAGDALIKLTGVSAINGLTFVAGDITGAVII